MSEAAQRASDGSEKIKATEFIERAEYLAGFLSDTPKSRLRSADIEAVRVALIDAADVVTALSEAVDALAERAS